MTVCPICRKPMKIAQATYDLGKGLDTLDLEVCMKDKVMHVEAGDDWTIGMG